MRGASPLRGCLRAPAACETTRRGHVRTTIALALPLKAACLAAQSPTANVGGAKRFVAARRAVYPWLSGRHTAALDNQGEGERFARVRGG